MENKINIVEILKDCPSGMELDCTIYEDVYFDYVDNINIIHCYIQHETYKTSLTFNQYGMYNSGIKAKCVIFPKGKTTWEGFQRPFKDGDIVFYNDTIAIFKEWGDETLFRTYVTKYLCCESFIDVKVPLFGKAIRREARFATEEEKQQLFNAIKDNGYKWNEETKTLEKLFEPKFKVGDIVQDKDNYKVRIFDVSIEDKCYGYESLAVNGIGGISFDRQDDWELVPNKFDITTLKPFESRVLVRNVDGDLWKPAIYGFPHSEGCYVVGGVYWRQCIPYEENKELLGTTNNPEEYESIHYNKLY
jgi:hypothetical protein